MVESTVALRPLLQDYLRNRKWQDLRDMLFEDWFLEGQGGGGHTYAVF